MYREYPIAMFDYQRVFSIFILCLHSEDIDIYIYISLSLSLYRYRGPFPGDFRTRPMDFARCQSLRASPLTPLVEGLLGIRAWEELKILGATMNYQRSKGCEFRYRGVVVATQVQPKCEDCKGWRLLSHRQRNRLQEKTVQQCLILRLVSNIFSHFCLGGTKFKMTKCGKVRVAFAAYFWWHLWWHLCWGQSSLVHQWARGPRVLEWLDVAFPKKSEWYPYWDGGEIFYRFSPGRSL